MTKTSNDILNPDTRAIFSKYVPDHIAKLKDAVKKHLPASLNDFQEASDNIYKEMSLNGILLVVDNRFIVFDTIWDNFTQTKTETENNDQSSGSVGSQALAELRS